MRRDTGAPSKATAVRWLPAALLGIAAVCSATARVDAAPEPARRVAIRVWDYPRWPAGPDSVDRFHWMRAQIAAFERAHPHVRVDLTRLSWAYGADKVRVAVLAGAGPDLVAGAPMTPFIARGLVEPVDAYLTDDDRADYLPAALDAFSWNGQTWGWPWYLTGTVLLVNEARFAAAGVSVPAAGRWTVREFEAALAALSEPDADPPRYGLGFSVRGALGIWPWLYPAGAAPVDGARARLDQLSARRGVAQLRRYIARGWAPPGSGGLPVGPVWEAFAVRQTTAVAPFGVWAVPALQQRADFPFRIVHYPHEPERAAPTFVAVSGWMVLRHDDAARRDAAMAFARHLTSAARQDDLRAYGVFPTRQAVGDMYAGDPHMQQVAAVLAEGRPIPVHARWPQFEDALATAVQRTLTGGPAADVTLADAQTRFEASAPVESGRRAGDGTRVRGGTFGVVAGAGLAALAVLVAGGRGRWRFALCAAPAVAILAALMVWPLVWSVLLSFGTFDVTRGWFGEWVGMRHYAGLIHDFTFRAAVRNTVLYTVAVVPTQVAIALVLASLIAPFGARSRAWFRGAFYLPGVTSVVVLSVVWRWLFNEDAGALNGFLGFWGAPPVRWLSDPNVALWSIVLMTVARPPGGPMLIYLAALDALPQSVQSAAALDGASPLRRWWHITLPLVRPTTVFLLVTGLIGSFQVFAQVYVLTDGGPGTATTVLVHQIYTTAMRDFAFGRASAMAVVLTVLLGAAAYWQTRGRSAAVEY